MAKVLDPSGDTISSTIKTPALAGVKVSIDPGDIENLDLLK